MRVNTINRDLAVVRRILTLAARLWRDESGLTWLETAPLLQMLECGDYVHLLVHGALHAQC